MTNETVGVVSLGCSKNLVDTERMMGALTDAGFAFTPDAGAADILIVNTCGFIAPAKQESIEAILDMAAYKKNGKCRLLVVTGCLAERYRTELLDEMPEIDILIGVNEYEKLPALLLGRDYTTSLDKRMLATPPFRAYLRIADGCENRCAYCAIPLIRGGYRSLPMDALTKEAQRLADSGVTELTLIAQDTSGYGKDIYGEPRLMELMEALGKIDSIHWLRVLYTYPDTVTPALVRRMAENEKICNYLDMPLQHINDGVLKRMNRRCTRAHIERLMDDIRKNAPGFILRTTMLVGFPGETDAEFDELLRFLRDYPFDRLGAFAFSPEEDTAAFHMPDQIPDDVKQARLDALMVQQQGISLALNRARVGDTLEALIEHKKDGVLYARSYAEAPEADGRIKLPAREGLAPGQYIRIKLTDASVYDLEGIEA